MSSPAPRHRKLLLVLLAAGLAGGSAFIGEGIGAISLRLNPRLLQLLVDNAAHGIIAACCWASTLLCFRAFSPTSPDPSALPSPFPRPALSRVARLFAACLSPPLVEASLQLSLAYVLGCLLDFDHFAAARSFNYEDARSFAGGSPSRPFGHAVIFIPTAAAAAALLLPSPFRPVFPLMLSSSWLSHQLRDSIRRGLWLWPLPLDSTPPLPFWLYASLLALIPVLAALLLARTQTKALPSRWVDEAASGLHVALTLIGSDGSSNINSNSNGNSNSSTAAAATATRRLVVV